MKKLIIGATLGATFIAGAVGFAAVATANDEPSPPPWVNQDGTLNEDRLPDTLPMLDRQGRVIPGKSFEYRKHVLTPPQGGPRVNPGPGTHGVGPEGEDVHTEVVR